MSNAVLMYGYYLERMFHRLVLRETLKNVDGQVKGLMKFDYEFHCCLENKGCQAAALPCMVPEYSILEFLHYAMVSGFQMFVLILSW